MLNAVGHPLHCVFLFVRDESSHPHPDSRVMEFCRFALPASTELL
jgi:hypothetical protein